MRISLPWDYRSAVLSTWVFRDVVPILVILGGKEQIPPGRLRWYLRLTGLLPRCERGHWNVKAVGLSCLLGNLILNGTTCGMSSLGLQSSQCPRTYKDLWWVAYLPFSQARGILFKGSYIKLLANHELRIGNKADHKSTPTASLCKAWNYGVLWLCF